MAQAGKQENKAGTKELLETLVLTFYQLKHKGVAGSMTELAAHVVDKLTQKGKAPTLEDAIADVLVRERIRISEIKKAIERFDATMKE